MVYGRFGQTELKNQLIPEAFSEYVVNNGSLPLLHSMKCLRSLFSPGMMGKRALDAGEMVLLMMLCHEDMRDWRIFHLK